MKKESCIRRTPTTMPFSILEIDTPGFHALVIRMDNPRDANASSSFEGSDDLAGRITQAEAAVAWAAVAGLSNREIAKQRGSAARTIAVQLCSIYRKLGISSRSQLAALIAGVPGTGTPGAGGPHK